MAIKTLRQSETITPRPGLRPYCIVLRDMGPEHVCQFATHVRFVDELGGHWQGDYHRDRADAEAAYNLRLLEAIRRDGDAR